MNRTLRWILYALLGLVVLGLIAGAVIAIFGGVGYGAMMRPGLPYYDHMRIGVNPVRWIFGALLCLGFFLLLVLGIAALVSALVRRDQPLPPPAATTPVTTGEKPCPNCGRMTQADWKTCPYCGTPLT
jgi:hypothetical protein